METGQQAEFPNGHVISFKPGVTKEQIGAVARAYAEAVQIALSNQRVNFILHAVLAWLCPKPKALRYWLGYRLGKTRVP